MTVEPGDSMGINNAGMIILWPFLTRYFDQLSLLEDGVFKDEESVNRAIYLLQYLVFDETDFPEYELVLNKILAGMPLENRVDPVRDLTEEEKELSESLLNGVIANWEKVKNSSPEAIQLTYFRRPGILTFQADSIELEVEKRGVDVLLDSISWSISAIKLPWMELPVYVQWR